MSLPLSLRARLADWLVHPWLPLHLALLAVVFCLPALGVGWQLDDNFHRVVLLGSPASNAGPLEIFSVLRNRPGLVAQYKDAGIFPWWTSPDFKIAFFRPLSAATAWLDFQLWPNSGPLQHAHSLLWFGGLIWAATVLYRRLLGASRTAGLAALLYAVDDAHGTAAGWLANRNALIATFFGILCLVLHDRWRRDRQRSGAWLSPLLLGLALAGGELALGAVGFLVAYALFLDRGPPRQKLVSLVPAGLVATTWAIAYRQLGFGASGSGLYIDPLGGPGAFGIALVERAPFFLAGQLTPLAADLGSLTPPGALSAVWWLALALVVLLLLAFLTRLGRRRTARFWILGTLLSVVPLCATFPTNRVLFFTGLGIMPLVADWLGARSQRWYEGALAAFLLVTHLVLAPILLPVTARIMKTFGEPVSRSVLTLPNDSDLADQQLVVVNAPDYLTYVSQIPALLFVEGRPFPRQIRGLAIGPSAVEVVRVDERTLDLRMEGGFLGGPLGALYRQKTASLPPGRTLEVAGMSATVLDRTAEGVPRSIRFRFDRPLEVAGMRWVFFADQRFVPFDPPAVGDKRLLPAERGPFDLLLSGTKRR